MLGFLLGAACVILVWYLVHNAEDSYGCLPECKRDGNYCPIPRSKCHRCGRQVAAFTEGAKRPRCRHRSDKDPE